MDNSEANDHDLPILKYRQEILKKVEKNRVIIIQGSTGCGKTTKVPNMILDDALEKRKPCNILITQPRKLAAISLAKRVSKEKKTPLGELIGYQVGLDKKLNIVQHETKVLFCTAGVVLQKLTYKQEIDHFSHIILDEIHEREIDTDLLIMIIREFLLDGTNETKLILMSATFDHDEFMQYFTVKNNYIDIKPSLIKIESKLQYNVDIVYLDDLDPIPMTEKIIQYSLPSISPEMYSLAAKIVIFYLRNNDKSILVFLPGIYEIECAYSAFSACNELKEKCLILVLHSSLSVREQQAVFTRSAKPKIILSTNISESSVTIPEIGCVVDFCLTKSIICNDSTLSSLKMEWTSKNSCIQRAGRTGRVCDGIVYRLVHRNFYERRMAQANIPEMTRAPLEKVVLRVKLLDRELPVNFLSKCLNPPNNQMILNAILVLKEMGGLTLTDEDDVFIRKDGDVTYVGRVMASLPIDIHLTKLIILGYLFSIKDEAIVIAAALSNKSIFQNRFNKKFDDYTRKLFWSHGSTCDSIAMLNAYKIWEQKREEGSFPSWEEEQEWCENYGLDRKNLHEMRRLIQEIQHRLVEAKTDETLCGSTNITSWSEAEKPFIIKICLAGTFLSNMYIQGKSDDYSEREAYKSALCKNPYRTVFFRRMNPDLIGHIYTESVKKKFYEYGITNSTKDMEVIFDSSKVFVTFLNDNHDMIDDEKDHLKKLEKIIVPSGMIPPEVYKAVKFRKTGLSIKSASYKRCDTDDNNKKNFNFELKVMSPKDTEQYALKYGVIEEINGKYKIKNLFYIEPSVIYFPTYITKEMNGVVTHIEHCHKFYFQPYEGQNMHVLKEIQDSLAKEDLIQINGLSIDQLVIALHDGNYKRAKIVKVIDESKTADCFMFDYGYTVKIPFAEIYDLDDNNRLIYFSLYERCFECKLAEIKPSHIKCPRGVWTKTSVEMLRQKALNKMCTISIYSTYEEKVSVKLYVDEVCLNEYLIQEGYARECKESYHSRLEHDLRVGLQVSNKWISREQEFREKVNKMIKGTFPPPSDFLCNKVIKLDGPYSPLETQIDSISCSKRGLIKISPLSVNSVTLDNDVENYDGQVIVAVEVNENKIEGTTLHNVTLMPNIHGLPVLLALIFAPNMIFYRSSDLSRVVAMKFGLGANDDTFEPHFYEHDCELLLNYDHELEDDIMDINELRHNFSQLLTVYENKWAKPITNEEKGELLHDIKHLILKIFGKNRQAVATETNFYPESNTRWMTEDQSDMPYQTDIYRTGYKQIKFPPLKKC